MDRDTCLKKRIMNLRKRKRTQQDFEPKHERCLLPNFHEFLLRSENDQNPTDHDIIFELKYK